MPEFRRVPFFDDSKEVSQLEKNDVFQKRLNDFLANLRRSQGVLSRGTLLTLRGQALKGDIEGAERGLARLCGRIKHY